MESLQKSRKEKFRQLFTINKKKDRQTENERERGGLREVEKEKPNEGEIEKKEDTRI